MSVSLGVINFKVIQIVINFEGILSYFFLKYVYKIPHKTSKCQSNPKISFKEYKIKILVIFSFH